MEDTAFSMARFGRWIHAFSILLRSGERKQLFRSAGIGWGPEFLTTPPLYVENFSIKGENCCCQAANRPCMPSFLINRSGNPSGAPV